MLNSRKDSFDGYIGPPLLCCINDETIIAFCTCGDVYRSEGERLTRRIDELNLKYDITVVTPRGEWVGNCVMKSEFSL